MLTNQDQVVSVAIQLTTQMHNYNIAQNNARFIIIIYFIGVFQSQASCALPQLFISYLLSDFALTVDIIILSFVY